MKKISDTLKGAVLGAVGMALTISMGITALAGPAQYKDVHVGTNVDVYVDGNHVEPKNASGKPVDVFIFNDTTYVPVRALSEYWGKDVQWDGDSRSVYITEKSYPSNGESGYLLDVLEPYETFNIVPYDGNVTLAGKDYNITKGIKLEYPANGDIDLNVYYNTEGKYNTIEFNLGHIDGSGTASGWVEIYADNKRVLRAEQKWDDMPKHYTATLNHCTKLQIKGDGVYRDEYMIYDLKIS